MKLLLFALAAWPAVGFSEPGWQEHVQLFGDFRWRSQVVRREAMPFRYVDAIRVRPGLKAPIEGSFSGVLRLALGEVGKTITGTNQTLTNADKKDLWIDLAYVNWAPDEIITVKVGKIDNLWKSAGDAQHIFDSDYTPEGVAFQRLPKTGVIVTTHAHWLKERYSDTVTADQGDSFTLGAQLGYVSSESERPWKVLAGFLAFTNFKGAESLSGKFDGNSNASGVYLNDYELGVLGGELQITVFQQPLLLFSEVVKNVRIVEKGNAAIAGAKYRKIREKGDWAVEYNFRYTEADAVFAVLSDSDVGQRADARGHTVAAQYAFGSKLKAALTNYFWEVGLANPTWYHRINLDFLASF